MHVKFLHIYSCIVLSSGENVNKTMAFPRKARSLNNVPDGNVLDA